MPDSALAEAHHSPNREVDAVPALAHLKEPPGLQLHPPVGGPEKVFRAQVPRNDAAGVEKCEAAQRV